MSLCETLFAVGVGLFCIANLGLLCAGVRDYIRFLVWKRNHDKTNDG